MTRQMKYRLLGCTLSALMLLALPGTAAARTSGKSNTAVAAATTELEAAFTAQTAVVGVPIQAVLKQSQATALRYAWQVGGKSISNTTDTYIPTENDYEKLISVTITADDTQSYTASLYFSALPVVYINTVDEQEITSKEDYINASCKIQGNDSFSSAGVLYDGGIQIRGRGNYTWEHDKEPYKIKLDTKTNLFGMGKNKHWVLLAEYMDPTHLRNSIFPSVSEALGMDFTAQSQPVVLMLNGSYNGMYYLSENVRIDTERVNIYNWEETAEDIAKAVYKKKSGGMTTAQRDALEAQLQQDLTWITSGSFSWNGETLSVSSYVTLPADTNGGYLLELDTYDDYHLPQVSGFETEGGQPIQFANPEYAVTNDTMFRYAEAYMQAYENAVSADDFYATYAGRQTHYSQLFDMNSLVQYWFTLELSANSDGMRFSNYMYQDFDSLFRMGPAWDYDWTWNAGYTVPTDEWQSTQSYYNNTVHWYQYLITDPYFIVQAYEKYQDIAAFLDGIVTDGGTIDRLSEKYRGAAEADLTKWHSETDYTKEVAAMKTYATARFDWLDAQFASVETLAASLGYEASDKLFVRSVATEGTQVRVTADVTDTTAKTVTFHVNGLYAGSAAVSGGSASVLVPLNLLKTGSDSLNTVQIRLKDANGSYLAAAASDDDQTPVFDPWGQWEEPTINAASPVYSDFSVFTRGELGLSAGTMGDVNADGSFNAADVQMLEQWLVQASEITDWKSGDFDGNGKLNAADLALMKRSLLKK